MTKKRQPTSGLPKAPQPKKPETSEEQSAPVRPSLTSPLVRRTTQEYRSRAERETEIQRLVIVGTAAAVGLVVVILLGALIVDGLIRPNQLAAQVNDQGISVADFQRRVRIERAFLIQRVNNAINNRVAATGQDVNEVFGELVQTNAAVARWWDELNFPDQLGLRVLDDMIDDGFIRAEAARRGITVTEEDIDRRINEFIGFDPEEIALIGAEPTETPVPTETPTPFVSPTPSPTPTETPTPTLVPAAEATEEADPDAAPTVLPTFTPVPTATAQPTLTREEVEQNFQNFRTRFLDNIRRRANVSDGDVREFFRALAYRTAVGEALAGDTENGQFVDLRQITVLTEEEAQDVLNALAAGESFADLARQVSRDELAQQGGELGLRGVFELRSEVIEALRDAAIGETVGPVETTEGFVIFQVRARETQELNEFQRDTVIARALTEWLEDQRAENPGAFQTFDVWTENVPRVPAFVYEPL